MQMQNKKHIKSITEQWHNYSDPGAWNVEC